MSQEPTTEIVQAPKRTVTIGNQGIRFETMGDIWRFTEVIQKSGMAPKGMGREGMFVAIQLGLEVGLSPMSSIQNIAVINGRPSLWGDAMLALCQGNPEWDQNVFREYVDGAGEKMVAHCIVGRRGMKEPVHQTFSAAEAIHAKLWKKPGPWSDYPRRMLQMRARSWALRDAFADSLRGMVAVEEARDVVVRTVDDGDSDFSTGADAVNAKLEAAQKPAPPADGVDANIAMAAPLAEQGPPMPWSDPDPNAPGLLEQCIIAMRERDDAITEQGARQAVVEWCKAKFSGRRMPSDLDQDEGDVLLDAARTQIEV